MNKKLALSIVFALFLLAGCAASGPKLASSAEDIVGTWQSTVTSLVLQFNEDGTFRGEFSDGSDFIDEFRFEGTRLFLKDVGPTSGACQSQGAETGIYEVELLENGNLKFTVIEDDCQLRITYIAGGLVEVEWEPVP